jgi:tRNA A37 methylthiotransferase MiaB
MTTTYHLSANDLSEDFLKSLKSMYKGKTISITVETEMDETEYLLSSEANRKFLLESMKQAEKGELIKVDIGKADRNERR